MVYKDEFKVFSGSSNQDLSERICNYLDVPIGGAIVKTFSDGEIQIEISDNVRSKDVFVVQSTCSPTNNNLMELLLIIDALKRSSVKRITAVIPYYGYARQDRKVASRVPISAKLVADVLTVAGANRVITMDLHAGQIQGFFNIPVDNLYSAPIFLDYLKSRFLHEDVVMVSPDAGGVERARAFAKRLNASLVIIDKRREGPNKAKAMNVIGDVDSKIVIILDDMVDTAGTLTEAAMTLKDNGAKDVYGCCTHPVLSGPAIDRIKESVFENIFVTDTIPLNNESRNCSKIQVFSVAEIIGEAIIRCHRGDSVTSLFV